MAIGTATAIIAGLAGIGAGLGAFGVSKMGEKKGGGAPPPAPSLPSAPSPEAGEEKAGEAARRRRAAMTQTTYTSPLGTAGQANIARKTLLGQ